MIDIENRAESSYLHHRRQTLEPTTHQNKAVQSGFLSPKFPNTNSNTNFNNQIIKIVQELKDYDPENIDKFLEPSIFTSPKFQSNVD